MAGGPLSTMAEVLAVRPAGAFLAVTVSVGEVADRHRPGQFLSLPDPDPTRLLRRSVQVARASGPGMRPGTVELVFAPEDPLLAAVGVGANWPVIGPLGRPFALPKEPVSCLLAGIDAHAAPLLGLVDRLAERGCTVHLLLGGADSSRVLPTHDVRRSIRSTTVVTEDGSMGPAGHLPAMVAEAVARTGAAVVYAGASWADLHGIAAAAEAAGAWSQTVLADDHPCGTGLCHGCPVPVVGEDGIPRSVRGCTEGPVFRGDRVRWQDLLTGAEDER